MKLPQTLYVRIADDGEDPYFVAAASIAETIDDDGPSTIGVYQLAETLEAEKTVVVTKPKGRRIARLLLVPALLLFFAGPVAAEEIITPLGDRWYAVSNPDVIVIPASGVTPLIVICLDEVPGGLDSTPSIRVEPLTKGKGFKRTVTVRREGFFPIPDARFMAYASFVLEGQPGVAYDVSAIIRGKQ